MLRSLLLTAATITGATLLVGTGATAEPLDDRPWRVPERPPRCTEAEAATGDVGHCLLSFYGEASRKGFGEPPAPGAGDGWSWSGANYNGSPALATWETDHIVANRDTVAGIQPGQLETHHEVQALIEGFLHEITLNGYEVRHAIAYSYRCTSGNGGWNCPSGDPDDLSLHAYGLAIDMNSDHNPIRSYGRVDGATACRTPIDTDMPRWMIETAERWGLYWGGYGWSSGCIDADTERDSVFRDPPHFEFRGTVEQARAIADFNRGRLPDRPPVLGEVCFDVVDGDGETVERCNLDGRPEAEWRLPIVTDAPEGATAALINLTATATATPGFFTLEDCAARSGPRETSALNFAGDDTVAAMAVVPLDGEGRFCVFRSTAAHSVVDVLGFVGSDGEPMWFDPSVPTRLTDTREDGACAPNEDCSTGPVPADFVHHVPTDDERPRVANVTVVGGGAPGYVQAGTCDRLGPDVEFSNLNHVDEHARANLALVGNGEAGSCVYAMSSTHVIVDELGALDADEGYGWQLAEPRRVLDTRECADAWCDERPDGGTVIEIDLDTDAPGAALAVTVTEPGDAGFVTIAPCDAFDGDPVGTSNVNHVEGQTATNLALVALDEGRTCVYTLSPAHLVVDLQAELTVEQTAGLAPIEPTRVHDSRR